MTRPSTDCPQWVTVDEGWGRKAVDFATLSEPGNCREYVAMHHRLGVDTGDQLLDVACGSGLVRVSNSSSHTGSSMSSAWTFRSPGTSRTHSCTRARAGRYGPGL